MTDDLYERYKATLRAGHVALLRGALQEAAEEYRTAVAIAPSRALPHTSLGGVFMRLGHLQDALTEFTEAANLAPHDEGALLGLAEALSLAGQRVDAAAALDRVAQVQEASGRLPEAADTLRRGLELEDSPERLQRHRALLRQIRMSEGDQAAEHLLARALRLREEPQGPAGEQPRRLVGEAVAAEISRLATVPEPVRAEAVAAVESALAPAAEAVEDVLAAGTAAPIAEVVVGPQYAEPGPLGALTEIAEEVEDEVTGVAVEESLALDARTLDETLALRAQAVTEQLPEAQVEPMPEPIAEREPTPEAESAAETAPGIGNGTEPEALEGAEAGPETSANGLHIPKSDGFALPEEIEPPVLGVIERAPEAVSRGGGAEVQRQPTGNELLSAAEAAEGSGDLKNLRSLLVWAARAYAREGRFEAALETAHRLLQRYPGDVDAHLVLVELYVARDWDTLAIDKLTLLDRLAQLGEDEPTHERLRAVASRAFPADPRLASILGE